MINKDVYKGRELLIKTRTRVFFYNSHREKSSLLSLELTPFIKLKQVTNQSNVSRPAHLLKKFEQKLKF